MKNLRSILLRGLLNRCVLFVFLSFFFHLYSWSIGWQYRNAVLTESRGTRSRCPTLDEALCHVTQYHPITTNLSSKTRKKKTTTIGPSYYFFFQWLHFSMTCVEIFHWCRTSTISLSLIFYYYYYHHYFVFSFFFQFKYIKIPPPWKLQLQMS